MPLSRVIARAHTGLDQRAKTLNGRDSLTVEVIKPGGLSRTWVSAWASEGANALVDLAAELRAGKGAVVSSRFLYVLQGRYGDAILPVLDGAPEGEDPPLLPVLVKEAMENPSVKALGRGEVERRMRKFLAVYREKPGSAKVTRCEEGGDPRPATNMSAGPTLKFLAKQGRWPEGQGETDG